MNLNKEIEKLVELQIVRRAHSDDFDDPNTYYCFCNGFMKEMVRARLLSREAQMLTRNYAALTGGNSDIEDFEKLIPPYMLQDKVFKESVMEGYLMKCGTHYRNWKKRYFVLRLKLINLG